MFTRVAGEALYSSNIKIKIQTEFSSFHLIPMKCSDSSKKKFDYNYDLI